jgi:hypothetical protein
LPKLIPDLGGDFLHFAVADAGSANLDTFTGTFDQCMNVLQVQIPTTLGYIMGVADAVSELRATAADFTSFCHKTHSCPAGAEQFKFLG